MNLSLSNNEFVPLIKREGWDIEMIENEYGIREPRVVVYGRDFAVNHPFFIHGQLYLKSDNPEIRFKHLKAMHDILWPDALWHRWSEERYWAHCEGWKFITMAAGASAAKSFDAAGLAILFYWACCYENAVVVASTTLQSIESRIWGYINVRLKQAKLKLPYKPYRGKPPRILYDRDDTLHGMFAVAASRGDDEESIKNWIGRHPAYGLMVILDECTDMPPAILNAVANLETSQFFQMLGIGNSNSEHDLHGAMSTPLEGWDSIDPMVHDRWVTQHDSGICLYNNPYKSPAILDPDPEKRKKLGKFLITQEEIDQNKLKYGENSKSFWRFCMGFWKTGSSTETVVSEKFLNELRVRRRAEWKGDRQTVAVAGLDFAISTGGDKCVLRVANVGWDIHGDLLIDFCGDKLVHYIDINVNIKESPEAQVAKQVIELLHLHGIPLNRLAVDATGQGRAIGEVLKLTANSAVSPIKIYHTRHGDKNKDSFDVVIKTPTDMWFTMRDYMQADLVRGMDEAALQQMVTRRVEQNAKTGKSQIISKRDYKSEMNAINPAMAHSPDEADAACLCLQAAIMTAGLTLRRKDDTVLRAAADAATEDNISHIMQERLRLSDSIQMKAMKEQRPGRTFSMGFKPVKNLKKLKPY